jgi:ribosomal protein S18 acetylase RimI-like enzyme
MHQLDGITGEMSDDIATRVPLINLRRLTIADIPNLPQIRPTYRTTTILSVERTGEGISTGWQLQEKRLTQPFDKGELYNFDVAAQENIRERLLRPDDTYQRIAEFNGRLIGLLELDLQYWNNTVTLSTLMIDIDFREQGLGRRLWHRSLDFARQAEVRAIMVETQNTNVAACKFYARMGCRLVGINEAFYTNDPQDSEIALFWAYFMPGY